MGKKFLNNSTKRISFGKGNIVEPGEVIELSDELVEKKKVGIEQMLESGQIVKGGKKKVVDEEPEEEKEEEPEEESEEEPEGKPGKPKGRK